MKIAVPTNDGTSLSDHFGRSAAFLVFDIEDGKIAGSSLRANNGCHPHQHQDHACHGHDHGDGQVCQDHERRHAQGGQGDHHAGIVATLEGCDIVICGGIGARAVDALISGGIRPVFVNAAGPASLIVESYLANQLQLETSSSCHRH